jgi:hypothetical protein
VAVARAAKRADYRLTSPHSQAGNGHEEASVAGIMSGHLTTHNQISQALRMKPSSFVPLPLPIAHTVPPQTLQPNLIANLLCA